ncbi:MAG: hypothetical protein N2C12_03690, partial [Planctomycetales bacterium]
DQEEMEFEPIDELDNPHAHNIVASSGQTGSAGTEHAESVLETDEEEIPLSESGSSPSSDMISLQNQLDDINDPAGIDDMPED